jgi:PAS domain S-box-containing protein
MNLYAWLSLSASMVTALLGIAVYSLNRKSLLNKLFLLTALLGLYWTFTEFMMWQSSNALIADFWNDLGFLWPFFVVLVLHFALVYTGSSWLKNKFTYVILYLPAVFFAVIDYATDLINGDPVLQYWGYEDTAPETLAYNLSSIWVSLLAVLALLICLTFYLRTTDETKKKQSKFVTIGFAIPIFTYLVTNVVFPYLSIDVPNLGHIATLFFGIFVAYAILKHELFTFDAAMAADNIVSTMPDSLILADMKGKIIKMNRSLINFLGYDESELTGKSITSLCVEEKRCAGIIEALLEKRRIRNYELTCKTKSGDRKSVLFSGSVVKSKTGRDIGFTLVVHDITERKSMEERLVKAERLASIGELAGQIGHDLRNPLTGIKSAAFFLRKKGERLSETEREQMLEIIDSSVKDSNRIINGLVEYSSDLQLQVSACSPNAVLLSALEKAQIPDRIQVTTRLIDAPDVFMDASKIEGVFARVIMNAVEAMPEKGVLEVRNAQNGSNLEIVFTDSGVGIPKDVLVKLFSPLVTTKAKGMGLGLAICRRIVDAHKGRITVDSIEGKGTTVTIVLPIKSKNKMPK